jgi:peptidoglycan/LPS O-acetylase OafA/YrhL
MPPSSLEPAGPAIVSEVGERARPGQVVAVAPTRAGARNLQLDILRGVAILMVLVFHSPLAQPGEAGVLRPLDLVFRFGWSGVDLFFVLSGYLIGGLLFAEIKKYGTFDMRRFLIRRMLRIWPPYYCLLLVMFVRTALEPGSGLSDSWSKCWPAFIHITNFIETPRTQLWSLAVEEQFYLLLPIFLWALLRFQKGNPLTAVPWACAILGVACLALRFLFVFGLHSEPRLPMDALFFGVNLAYLHAFKPDFLPGIAKRGFVLVLVALILFLPAFLRTGPIRHTIGLTSLYLGYGLILVWFVYLPPGSWMLSPAARFVAFIGTHSYSIYLWHRDTSWEAYELALSAGRKLGLPSEATWALHTFAYVASSVVGGIILGRLIETPVQKIRERLFPPRSVQDLPTSAVVARVS